MRTWFLVRDMSQGGAMVNWPWHRLWLSRLAAGYVRLLTGMPVRDPTGGFKCFRRQTLQRLPLAQVSSTGYGFQVELTHQVWQTGGRVVEEPITFTERTRGHSKLDGGIIREAVGLVWWLAWQNRLRRRPKVGGGVN